SSFDFYSTLPGIQGATLVGHQIVQTCQPSEKRLLAASWMVKAFHREELPLDGVMGLIQQGAHYWHLRVFEHRIPTRLLGLKPAPYALPVGHPCAVSHVVGKMAEPLTQGKHPQALALARPVQQRMELGA